MTAPSCPEHYLCTFTPQHLYVVNHFIQPWWKGVGGIVVAGLAVAAIFTAVIVAIVYVANAQVAKRRENATVRGNCVGGGSGRDCSKAGLSE